MHKKLFCSILILSLLLLTSGCERKGQSTQNGDLPPVTLTFYGLFDNESVMEPFIQSYQSAHPNVTILYKKFTDPEAYMNLIVNELAEGEGPDIFMLSNTAFPQHYKKLTPAPESLVSVENFKSSFVDIAAKDLIIPNEEGLEQIWGMPLYIDTLALYYNDSHFEDVLPAQGEPSTTWEGLKNDVALLNKQDQSFERFARSGIALGRGDNILRAFDVLALMMLQHKTSFYTGDYTKVLFGNDPNALAALELYTSFGLPSQKNYSWNKYLADAESPEQELSTFARGKVSMIFAYSYAYEDLINEVNRLTQEGEETMNWQDIKIAPAPQVNDPETSAESRIAYANYFVPVVGRTSPNSEVAWDFLLSMSSTDLLRTYNQNTHRPSALRSLINEQMQDPIYGVFASQVGFATDLTMSDAKAYETLFLGAITDVLETARGQEVLLKLSKDIQALIPSSGIKPTYVAPPTPEE
ncbi:hypothetical protein IPG41_00825 [Candidatus Peregrinibacteria bacterium]|nr:MAG: hypothetical protein IPG41_00825 [Candidatus Peregrinibacteria bacterium]